MPSTPTIAALMAAVAERERKDKEARVPKKSLKQMFSDLDKRKIKKKRKK